MNKTRAEMDVKTAKFKPRCSIYRFSYWGTRSSEEGSLLARHSGRRESGSARWSTSTSPRRAHNGVLVI